MRLIDADSLEVHEFYNGEWVDGVYKDDIDSAPTIEERKTGRWIDRGYMKVGYHCSECGGYVVYQTVFCPNCGAKMEVENAEV